MGEHSDCGMVIEAWPHL